MLFAVFRVVTCTPQIDPSFLPGNWRVLKVDELCLGHTGNTSSQGLVLSVAIEGMSVSGGGAHCANVHCRTFTLGP